jgi:hypothetical protein
VESKRRRIRRVNCSATTLALLAVLSASLAMAEDFKTIDGKIYKDATISHVEADGIVLRTKTGISKIYFFELPKDVQERFHYGSATPTGKAVTQRIDEAESAKHAAAFVDADRFAQQVATKLDERESILHGKQASMTHSRTWTKKAIGLRDLTTRKNPKGGTGSIKPGTPVGPGG